MTTGRINQVTTFTDRADGVPNRGRYPGPSEVPRPRLVRTMWRDLFRFGIEGRARMALGQSRQVGTGFSPVLPATGRRPSRNSRRSRRSRAHPLASSEFPKGWAAASVDPTGPVGPGAKGHRMHPSVGGSPPRSRLTRWVRCGYRRGFSPLVRVRSLGHEASNPQNPAAPVDRGGRGFRMRPGSPLPAPIPEIRGEESRAEVETGLGRSHSGAGKVGDRGAIGRPNLMPDRRVRERRLDTSTREPRFGLRRRFVT